MKKVLQILAIPVFCLAIGVFTSTSASALAVNCENITIQGSGSGSTNIVNCNDETKVTITCANKTVVTIDTTQEGSSGIAIVNGNTNAGSAISGAVNNVVDTDADVDSVCELAANKPTPVTPTPTPATPAAVTPVQTTKTASLPNTGKITSQEKAGLALGALVSLTIASRIGVSLYRKYSAN